MGASLGAHMHLLSHASFSHPLVMHVMLLVLHPVHELVLVFISPLLVLPGVVHMFSCLS